MQRKLFKVMTIAAFPLMAATPAVATPLGLNDGTYDITLYGCLVNGSTCTGSMTISAGAITGASLLYGGGSGWSSGSTVVNGTESIEFTIGGGVVDPRLSWGAIGYYDGPYDFLPADTMTWAAIGEVMNELTYTPLIGYDPVSGPIYGAPQTIYTDTTAFYGGWAAVTRTGDVPSSPPVESLYLADLQNLVLPSILDELDQPGSIAGLQGISRNVLGTVALAVRGDDQDLLVPVVFADPESVPEPATLALLGLGLAGIAAARRRERRLG